MDSEYVYQMVLVTLLLLLVGAAPIVLPALWMQGRGAIGCERAWHDLAERAGFTFEAGASPAAQRVVGQYRGRGLTLQLASVKWPPRTDTRIRLALRWPAGEFSMTENNPLTRLLKSVTLTPDAGDDRRFKRRFSIRSTPPDLAARLSASHVLRRKLLQARSVGIVAQDQTLLLTAAGVVVDAEYLDFLFSC